MPATGQNPQLLTKATFLQEFVQDGPAFGFLEPADMRGNALYESQTMDQVLAAYAQGLGFTASKANAQVWTHPNGRVIGLPTSGGVNKIHEGVLEDVLRGIQTELAKAGPSDSKCKASVFMPLNTGGHWKMVEIEIEKTTIEKTTNDPPAFTLHHRLYDPARGDYEPHLAASQALNAQINRSAQKVFTVDSVPVEELGAHSSTQKQQDGTSCGPIACWFAARRMQGLPALETGKSFEAGAKALRLEQLKVVAKTNPAAAYSLYTLGRIRDALLLRLKLQAYQEHFKPRPSVTLTPAQEEALGIAGHDHSRTEHDAWLAQQMTQVYADLAMGSILGNDPKLHGIALEAAQEQFAALELKPTDLQQQALADLVNKGLVTAEIPSGHYAEILAGRWEKRAPKAPYPAPDQGVERGQVR